MEQTNEATLVPPPYPLAMVVCDSVHRDSGTGKCFILGTFSVIHALSFPAIHPEMWLYVSLTNGRGEVPLSIRLVDADEEQDPLREIPVVASFPDPRAVVEFVTCWDRIEFQAPGEYRFQLFAQDEFLMERRVIVNKVRT